MLTEGEYPRPLKWNKTMTDNEGLKEQLAEYAHKSWSGWIIYMFSKMERQSNGDWWIPKWAYERWTRQSNTPYKDLSEDEKDSDRDESKAIMSITRAELTKERQRVVGLIEDIKIDFSHLDHHTIKEELWRLDQLITDIKEGG